MLNACLSAYNHTQSTSNLSHIFLQRGIQNVSAMWYYVHWQTVATYLDKFYEQLLLKRAKFHEAAQKGREAIRNTPTLRAGRIYKDSFLCVNYTRKVYSTDILVREPSPTPSSRSQDSSISSRSFMSGGWRRPATPRLSDSFITGDETVIRLKLHLLELEYKLITHRIVYASDLQRYESNLNATLEGMISMWLGTNFVDEVFYHKAKDFTSRRQPSSYREKRSRVSSSRYLQLLLPKPVKALRQTLHIVREIDSVIDPGWQANDVENKRTEERKEDVREGLKIFANKLHAQGHSYMIFIGAQDEQWWRNYLLELRGAWWLHMPWNLNISSRYIQRDLMRRQTGELTATNRGF